MSVVLAIQSTNHSFESRVCALVGRFLSCMHVLGALAAVTKSDPATNDQAQNPCAAKAGAANSFRKVLPFPNLICRCDIDNFT